VPESKPGEPGTGIMQSLRNLAATAVELLRTRLELIVTELEEERLLLLGSAAWAIAALVCLTIGILLLALLVVVLFWDTHRIAAIAVLAGVFLVAGIAMAGTARRRVQRRRKLLAASLEALRIDEDRLKRP
jgi:uncharacterized membrane protein YqjE